MRNNLRARYLTLSTKAPNAAHLARRIYRRQFINKVRRRIRGRSNRIQYDFTTVLATVRFDIVGDGNTIVINPGCILEDTTFFIRGSNHQIVIGKGCSFGKGSVIWFEDHHGALTIGDGTGFGSVHVAVTEPYSRIDIGKDCLFSSDIDIRTGDSHSIVDLDSGVRTNSATNVKIHDHVWVGAHSIILKGATVCENSVVATASVVTQDFSEANVVLAGNPAVVVKRSVGWLRERI